MATQTIIAEKMVFGGDCIAKMNGKTVFVPYAIPGEKLDVEIVEERRDYSNARIVNILEPSPHRVKPFCPLYGNCGGCNMQHIDASYQIELRSSILKDCFAREGIDIGNVEVIGGGPDSYRSRFQFHDGGLMAKSTNTVLPIDYCPCAVPEVNNWLKSTPMASRPKGRVHVFASDRIVSVKEGLPKIVIAQEPPKEDETESLAKKGKHKVMARFQGTVQTPHNDCTVCIAGKQITFNVQGFFQSNMEVLEKMISTLTANLYGTNALDMYSGAGTFSIYLADHFKNLTLVEHNRDAIVYAEQNLRGTQHESFGVSGDKWVLEHASSCISRNGPYDCVVVDPPRNGMEKSVCQWLCSSDIPRIRSISCDCATHARDAKFLIRSGYRLDKLYLLDFYPQTCHIESLALFEK